MIVCGDAREELATFPAEYFHACITSSPYWGLRDYSDAVECVFGGDEGCEHEWGAEQVKSITEQTCYATGRAAGEPFAPGKKLVTGNKDVSQGHFCFLCGAWRGQFGLEPSPEMYVEHTLEFLRAIRRVLRKDGTVWWNLGDSYYGAAGGKWDKDNYRPSREYQWLKRPAPPKRDDLKSKDLVMIPFRVALAAQADGWWLRSVIIWNKPNPMPESVRDRPTTSHEYVLLLTKSARYFYDADAIREPNVPGSSRWGKYPGTKTAEAQAVLGGAHGATSGIAHEYSKEEFSERYYEGGRNKRTVWTIPTQPYPEAHFATFPEALVEPMILTTPTKCCAECGAGWERVVKRSVAYDHVTSDPGKSKEGPYASQTGAGAGTHDVRHGVYANTLTLGFRPTCSCDAGTKPAVIVDPFAGKGTVARGCRKNNRDWVMIEMNPDYIPMMERYLALADEEVEKQGETWVQPRMDLTS